MTAPDYRLAGVVVDGHLAEDYDRSARILRAARVQAGLTQADLAARLGCCQATVTLRENGKRTPPADDWFATADVLGFDVVLVRRGAR